MCCTLVYIPSAKKAKVAERGEAGTACRTIAPYVKAELTCRGIQHIWFAPLPGCSLIEGNPKKGNHPVISKLMTLLINRSIYLLYLLSSLHLGMFVIAKFCEDSKCIPLSLKLTLFYFRHCKFHFPLFFLNLLSLLTSLAFSLYLYKIFTCKNK